MEDQAIIHLFGCFTYVRVWLRRPVLAGVSLDVQVVPREAHDRLDDLGLRRGRHVEFLGTAGHSTGTKSHDALFEPRSLLVEGGKPLRQRSGFRGASPLKAYLQIQ